MTEARRRLLVTFGTGLCVAAAVSGWTWRLSVEGAFFDRAVAAPAYSGVFSAWVSSPDPWSPQWFVVVVGRWLVVALALLAGALAVRGGSSARPTAVLGAACLSLSLVALVLVLASGELQLQAGVWLSVVGAAAIAGGGAAGRAG